LDSVLVDPTGLEPAPYGLKVRYSATRVPGQQHFRSPIADCQLVRSSTIYVIPRQIGNWQSEIGNDLAVAEGFEPSGGRSNNPVPYQLGYATKNWLREQELNLPVLAYGTSEPPLLYSRVKVGGDEGSRTLIDRFTRPTLCYPVELHRH
jgi:hypothetical protein